jgi:hypothetical protein
MSKKIISSPKIDQKFKMNLIGENNIVQFIGSTLGTILTLICALFCILMFASLIISMLSGEKD